MDIPAQFRSKIGVYDIQSDGVKVKVTLVDDPVCLQETISEFKSHIETKLPVVGVDFKISNHEPVLLLLYTKDRCLIIQLGLISKFPKPLGLFLSDNSICFVGFKIDERFSTIRRQNSYLHDTVDTGLTGKGAEVRRLAAAVLKNPLLAKCADIFELASKSGLEFHFEMKRPADDARTFSELSDWEAKEPPDWEARTFSEEEIKYAIHDAYYCHTIGKKLLGML